ncbi:MAG: sensor histidine kinase [Flavisolibacter sp.]
MKSFKRYSFWKVFWIVLGVYIFFGLIGMLALSLMPSEADKVSSFFEWKTLAKTAISLLFSSLFFYFSINQYYHLIVERKKFIPYLRFSSLAVVVCFVYHVGSYYLFPSHEAEKYSTIPFLLFGIAINTLFFLGLSLLIAYLTNLRDEQKQRKVLEEQKMQLEVEKSQANFNFLKAQINPHFLHNTLNFLYAKSLPYSPELSEGILTLSDIMRYALSEGNVKDGKAPLKDEIEHVRNVIKINQLRFSNNLNVQFDVDGVVNGATIIPFILITLVENAFKHGDLKSNEYPIVIKLKIEKDQLCFYCRNKKKTGPKELSTGIGLDNIKKRLDLAYGKHYSFNVKDEAEMYTTELTITQL